MLLRVEEQEHVRQAVLEAFPDHPQIDVEFHENPHVIIDFPSTLELTRASVTIPSPVGAVCSTKFQAVHHSGPRSLDLISCGVIHCTQAYPALGSAMWFANPNSAGSAHRIVDNRICYRTLADSIIPWAAPGMNLYGMHLEFSGFVSWTKDDWKDHDRMLRRGAYKLAVDSKKHGFPLEWLGIHELKNGNRWGVTDHFAVSQAFHLSTHTDPRPNFPENLVLDYAKFYKKKL